MQKMFYKYWRAARRVWWRVVKVDPGGEHHYIGIGIGMDKLASQNNIGRAEAAAF